VAFSASLTDEQFRWLLDTELPIRVLRFHSKDAASCIVLQNQV